MAKTQPGKDWKVSVSEPRTRFSSDEHGGDIDEITIGDWFHLERMASHVWFLNVGGLTFEITNPTIGKNPTIICETSGAKKKKP